MRAISMNGGRWLVGRVNGVRYTCGEVGEREWRAISVDGREMRRDECSNVSDRILDKVNRGLHRDMHHPLGITLARIRDHFHRKYRKPTGSPMFSFHDNISPVVTTAENFDELLVPPDHVCRSISDSYYINSNTMLRSHTSAHEPALIRAGLDAFAVAGDVYRRDTIDMSHYPVFHQLEAVRLFSRYQIFGESALPASEGRQFLLNTPSLRPLGPEARPLHKQERHCGVTAKFVETELKQMLEGLCHFLFQDQQQHHPKGASGSALNMRWVPAYFPWTHPSFELELETSPGEWMEMLGCGIIEQDMLDNCGAQDKVGFAFGLGLERWAMKLFGIPDIRLFWSTDPGFLSQFRTDDPHKPIRYKEVSVYPPVIQDISFWLPNRETREFHDNDFYDIVGSVASDIVERVELIDVYLDKKNQKTSRCYKIFYRHLSKNLTHKEVNIVHEKIERAVSEQLGCTVR